MTRTPEVDFVALRISPPTEFPRCAAVDRLTVLRFDDFSMTWPVVFTLEFLGCTA